MHHETIKKSKRRADKKRGSGKQMALNFRVGKRGPAIEVRGFSFELLSGAKGY
jgi:hypothetical protein